MFVLTVVLTAFVAAGAVCPGAGVCAQSKTNAVRAAAVEANKRWLFRSLPSEMAERANGSRYRALRLPRIEP